MCYLWSDRDGRVRGQVERARMLIKIFHLFLVVHASCFFMSCVTVAITLEELRAKTKSRCIWQTFQELAKHLLTLNVIEMYTDDVHSTHLSHVLVASTSAGRESYKSLGVAKTTQPPVVCAHCSAKLLCLGICGGHLRATCSYSAAVVYILELFLTLVPLNSLGTLKWGMKEGRGGGHMNYML